MCVTSRRRASRQCFTATYVTGDKSFWLSIADLLYTAALEDRPRGGKSPGWLAGNVADLLCLIRCRTALHEASCVHANKIDRKSPRTTGAVRLDEGDHSAAAAAAVTETAMSDTSREETADAGDDVQRVRMR